MLIGYVLSTLRLFRRHRGYTVVNLLGLSAGLAACLLIGLFVAYELSYDRFHDNADRIVRVVENERVEDSERRLATTYGPLAPALASDVPSVERTVRVLPFDLLVRAGDQMHQEENVLFVDSTFFEVFSFPLLHGSPGTALDEPRSVVITEATARRYFGTGDALGKTLTVRGDGDPLLLTVTGVAADPPSASHLQFDFLVSFAAMRSEALYGPRIEHPENWEHPPLYTYVLLREGVTPTGFAAHLSSVAKRRMGTHRANTRSLHAEPLGSVHLHSGREGELYPTGSIASVRLFALIGVFILLLACVNHVNLATARASVRAPEVAMRKTLGAAPRELVPQFLCESVLMVALAFVLALAIARAGLPAVEAMAGRVLAFDLLLSPRVLAMALGLVLAIGVCAGAYPAVHLARLETMEILTGRGARSGRSAGLLRRGLVTFQFAVSLLLLIGTAAVFRQLEFMRNERLGFSKDQVVIAPLRDQESQFGYEGLKAEWERIPAVKSVSASSGTPGSGGGLDSRMVKPRQGRMDSTNLMVLTVDHDFVETYGMQIVAGRDFSRDFGTDAQSAFLINRTAADRLGRRSAVGLELSVELWFDRHFEKTGTVVGVIEDFRYRSARHVVDPVLFHILPNSYYYDHLSARVETGALAETLAQMERVWRVLIPDRPFEYVFLDQQFDALFRSEAQIGRLFATFSLLAVLIAALGLLGLSAFAAQRRTREFGIRKVLGASVASLIALLSREFVMLVLIAFVLAAPVAYLGVKWWLQGYVYRASIGPGVFVGIGLAVMAVAVLTVSLHAVRAASADPVRSLRVE